MCNDMHLLCSALEFNACNGSSYKAFDCVLEG